MVVQVSDIPAAVYVTHSYLYVYASIYQSIIVWLVMHVIYDYISSLLKRRLDSHWG